MDDLRAHSQVSIVINHQQPVQTMRVQHPHPRLPLLHPSTLPLLLPLLSLFAPAPASATFDCTFTIQTHKFDLSPLRGVHTVSRTEDSPPSLENTTVWIDLCQQLTWDEKLYPVEDRCKDGTQGTSSTDPTLTAIPRCFFSSTLSSFVFLCPPRSLSLLHLLYLSIFA
jgi:hypothetical protein